MEPHQQIATKETEEWSSPTSHD